MTAHAPSGLRATIAFVGAPGAGRGTNLRALCDLLPDAPDALPERLDRLALSVRAPWSGETLALDLRVLSAERDPVLIATADAIVFVADSDPRRAARNVRELDALERALSDRGRSLAETPHVMQYNKRDLRVLGPVRELREELNRYGADEVEAAAARGRGVLTALVLAVHALSPRKSRNPAPPPLRPSGGGRGFSVPAAVVGEKKTS